MRKIELTPYKVTIEGVDKDYDVVDAIVTILTSHMLQLNGSQLLKNNILATKFLECKEGSILLEEADYQMLKSSADKITGYGREDIELVQRILEAPQVEVEVKS